MITHTRIKFVNNLLSLANILVGSYLIFTPMYPHLDLFLASRLNPVQNYAYQSNLFLSEMPEYEDDFQNLKNLPIIPTLLIPQIGVNSEIFVGSDPNLLHKGLWHRPQTNTPDQGGNTVIVAHRFQYTQGPKTFYHLDKMKIGDRFAIFWNGVEYNYEVSEVKTVSPGQTEIEAPTEESIVTLYTCTPLWTAQNRFVVRAKQIQLGK